MDSALLSFFQQHKDLVTENRPLRLRLAHPTQMLEDVLLPQRVQGRESICGGIEYRILCVSLDAFIPLKELIALPVAVDIVTDRGDLRSVCGIVTEARSGDSDGGLASYQLVLRDALSIMEKRNNTRVFRNKNEVEIVQVILGEWRQTNPVIGTCFRYEMDESFRGDAYPRREFTMQYNESDAAFIRRLLKRRGIAWHFRADESNWPSHAMVLFDNADTLPLNAAGVVRYHRDAATEERDSITSWCSVRTLQPGRVSRFSWNYKNPTDTEFMTTTVEGQSDQGSIGNEMCATLDDYQILSPHAGDDHDDLCLLGQLAMKRHDIETKCFHGEGGVRDFCVGEYFELEGHPEIDAHPNGEREFVITSLELAISNNLSKELTSRVERLFSRSRWMPDPESEQSATRVKVKIAAVRRGIPIVPAFDPRTDVPNVPMQSAIVVGPEGEEVHCDELGRVKIRFRATREEDHKHAQGAGAAGRDYDSAWVRVVSNWAGNGPGIHHQCGGLLLPRVGSEVLIAFLGGDPDKPILIGQTYNQIGLPPALSRGGGLPESRYLSGIRSREIGGGRSNQLRFDDTAGEIGAQLASDHGKTQLNLGFLATERESGSAKPRGQGAELRSELGAVVRGMEGVLITSEIDGGGEDRMLHRPAFMQVVAGTKRIAEQLSKLAAKYADEDDACNELQQLEEVLAKWDEQGAQITAINGPSGVTAISGGPLLIGAATDVDICSSNTMRFSSAGKTYLRSAQGLRLFANQGGAKVVAAVGKLELRSNLDAVEIVAKKVVELISTADWINLKAKQGIRLNGGGSELVLSSEGIKGYTAGKNEMHAADHQTMKGKSMKADFPGSSGCEKQAGSAAQSGSASYSLSGG
ncbi:type VI secretion system Vgr family protein [Pseudoduganella violaceinigra]|uniref:type VI secretion system Vgr family protein n=1 Tax=Pseudoduganella violaceinigra TaxID=246602 RepID=UPI0004240931|nr:type VI secretion system Vgr family protein [Pseudoduganella violaceinigra]